MWCEWQSWEGEREREMAKPSSSATSLLTSASPTIQIKDMSEEHLVGTIQLLNRITSSGQIPDDFHTYGFHSDICRRHLHHLRIEGRRLTCILSVRPAVCNIYGSVHGGFVAAAAVFLSTACARAIVGEDKDVFLGELSITYLSPAPKNTEVEIEASVIRRGRNLIVIAVEFRLKETGKLTYIAHSTIYNIPMAKL